MECTDSNVSIDKTSKNKVSAVGAERIAIAFIIPVKSLSKKKIQY